MSTKVAFLGLGNMGRPMAANCVKAGFDVNLYDVVPASVAEAAKAGGTPCADIASAVRDAHIVFTMLPSNKTVEDLYLGYGRLFDNTRKGALLIDSSTVSPSVSRKVAAAAERVGFIALDAPVSGGTGGAAAGTLTFMVGGSAAGLEKARPLLSVMGKNIFHAGASGAGQVAKICNNMLLAIQMIGTSEALALGVKLGLDPATLSEIMGKSSGGNWTLEKYNPYPGVMPAVPASKDYQGGFAVDLMLKDLGLAAEAVTEAGATTPLGAQALALYQAHSKEGSGRLDFSSIITRFLRGAKGA